MKECRECRRTKSRGEFAVFTNASNAGVAKVICLECEERIKERREVKKERQGGSPAGRAAMDSQMRRLAALEQTELYQELVAAATARPKRSDNFYGLY